MSTLVQSVLFRYYRTALISWAAFIAGVFLLVEIVLSQWGEPDRSIWVYSDTPLRWVLFVMAILVMPALFQVTVAHGITRRAFATGSAVAIVILAAATGLYGVAGFLVERGLYAVGNGTPTVMERHVFDSTDQLHLVFAEYSLIAAAYLVAGWLIGVGYQRFRWYGTLFLPVTILPMVTVEVLLDTWQSVPPGTPPLETTGSDLPIGVALPLAAGVVALGLLAGRWLLHAVPLRPSSA